MLETSKLEIKLFYCYAREDKKLLNNLDTHLSNLKHEYQIKNWSDREIQPGAEWEKEINEHINTANIILLLISPYFMASDYCYGIEMKRALERHKEGTAHVIPILLQPVEWEDAPFSMLQVLPTNAKPVTLWQNRNKAFMNIAQGIRNIVEEILISSKTEEKWQKEQGDNQMLENDLAAYEEAIRLDPNNALYHSDKGATLLNLKRYEEALAVIEEAIRLDPNNALYYGNKSHILYRLKRYKEAQRAQEKASLLAAMANRI